MILLPAIVPFLLGCLVFTQTSQTARYALTVCGTLTQLVLAAALWIYPQPSLFNRWFFLDPPGLIGLSLISAVFFSVALFMTGYIERYERLSAERGKTISASFTFSAFFMMLSGLSITCISQHIGIFVVGLELAVLSVAPLIYYHRTNKSASAAWKFIFISAVAIGILMIGAILLSLAIPPDVPLTLHELSNRAESIDIPWYNAATLFFLIGLGVFMGLAPMHGWIPEIEEAAPSPVAALLSCGLSLSAFLGFFRIYHLSALLDETAFLSPILIGFGLFSMFTAAFFIVVQAGYKRLLSYMAIGQFGVLILGLGLGGVMIQYVFLHLIHYTLIMSMLFLLCTTISRAVRTYSIHETTDLFRRIPATTLLFIIGILAICGFPFFGLFICEFKLLSFCIEHHRFAIAGLFVVGLFFVFASVSYHLLQMVQSKHGEKAPPRLVEKPVEIYLPALFCLTAFITGIKIPDILHRLIAGFTSVFTNGGGI